jgi:hypothetical protein
MPNCDRWRRALVLKQGRESEGASGSIEPKAAREHGLHTRYAPTGTIVGQTEYASGLKSGWSVLLEDDGFPMTATRYEADEAAAS